MAKIPSSKIATKIKIAVRQKMFFGVGLVSGVLVITAFCLGIGSSMAGIVGLAGAAEPTADFRNIFFDEANTAGADANIELVVNKDLAYRGEKLIKITIPDSNHRGARIDGSTVSFAMPGADTLAFFMRTANGTYGGSLYLKVSYSGAVDASQVIDLKPYLKDGQLTDIWQQIFVPRAVIGGNFNNSFRAFFLSIDAADAQTPKTFLVDTITLENRQGLSIEKAEVLDNRHIMLTADKAPDITQARDPQIYSLIDNSGRQLPVEKVSFRTWVEGFGGTFPNVSSLAPIIKYYIYLTLAEPLASGQTYNMTADIIDLLGQNLPVKNNISFTSNFYNDISSSIKINQVGYLPDSPKIAYVGNYLGDGGEMTLPAGLIGYVRNASDQQIAFQDSLQKAPQADVFGNASFSGEDVWTLDFRSLQTPGQYYIQVPSIGRSYGFSIADNVYNDVYYKTARSLMYQRSDINLDTTAAGIWARQSEPTIGADGQPRTGYFHNSIQEMSPEMWALDEIPGTHRDLTGGWYDAADFSHYVKSAASAVNYLLTMYEIVPEHFTDNQLDLPGTESRNGAPDYLDNVKWETDWLAKMVGSNGCVSTVLGYQTWPGSAPKDENRRMWAITKNTIATAETAGALAQASRLMAHYFPEAAANYQAKALLAWQCLERFPTQYPVIASAGDSSKYCQPAGSASLGSPRIKVGCYFDYNSQSYQELSARIMSAIEMFRLTGDDKYHQVFKRLAPSDKPSRQRSKWQDWIIAGYTADPMNPARAYSYYLDPRADQKWKGQAKDMFIYLAAIYDKGNKFRYSVPAKDVSNIGYGTFTSSLYSYNYLLAYLASGDKNQLDKAKQALDTQLGANPLSKSFITGVGSNPVKYPMSNISDNDGVEEPVPGYLVMGPSMGLSYNGSYYDRILDYTYPPFRASSTLASYPVARKYVDSNKTTMFSEYSINSLAPLAAVYGYFSNNSSAPPTCTENWTCSAWSACSGGTQTRTCFDSNNCSTTTNRPTLSQSCTSTCSPNWSCSDWSSCSNNQQTRTCTDSNGCGITTGQPALAQSCSATSTTPATSATSTIPVSASIVVNNTPGSIVKVNAQDRPAVYYAVGGKKYLFVNRVTYTTWSKEAGDAGNKFATLKLISQAEFDAIATGGNLVAKSGSLIKFDNSPISYAVGAGGKLYQLADAAAQKVLFGSWAPYVIQAGFRASYYDYGNAVGMLTASSQKPE